MFSRTEVPPAPSKPARRQADTRRAVRLRRLRAFRRFGELRRDKVQPQSCDHDRTVMFVRPIQFSKNRPRPPRGIRPRMLIAPHPAGRSPRFRPRRSIFGEPSKLIKTSRCVSSAFLRPATCLGWPSSGRRQLSALPGQIQPRQAMLRATAPASRDLVLLSVCPTWGPGIGPAWGRTTKANLDNTRRGWACQPLSVIPARRLYIDLLRRPRTPARLRGSLPHIRQVNVRATPISYWRVP